MKISKQQFLELVDLAIAVHGWQALFKQGTDQSDTAFEKSLDAAIAEYVFWIHEADGSITPDWATSYKETIKEILEPWVHDENL